MPECEGNPQSFETSSDFCDCEASVRLQDQPRATTSYDFPVEHLSPSAASVVQKNHVFSKRPFGEAYGWTRENVSRTKTPRPASLRQFIRINCETIVRCCRLVNADRAELPSEFKAFGTLAGDQDNPRD